MSVDKVNKPNISQKIADDLLYTFYYNPHSFPIYLHVLSYNCFNNTQCLV